MIQKRDGLSLSDSSIGNNCPFCMNPDYKVIDALLFGVNARGICDNHKLIIMRAWKNGNYDR